MNLIGRMRRHAVVPAVGMALVLSACNASAASAPNNPSSKAPAACLHALDLAEVLLNDAGQVARIDSEIFEGKVSLADSARRLTDLATAQASVKAQYGAAKATCRGSR